MPLLQIENLNVSFPQHEGVVQAVRGISLSVEQGESVGIVGESGSGKSVTCMAALRLLREPPAQITADRLDLGGVDMLRANRRGLAAARGKLAAMVFQDPMTAFDPVFTIGFQIAETIRHVGTSDRNFYDRYYFNCHQNDGEAFAIFGYGQYPNLAVSDAFMVVVHGDSHRVVRASREQVEQDIAPFKLVRLEMFVAGAPR